jgi:hypothetical protein
MKNKGACRALCGVVLGLVGLFMLPGGVLAGILFNDTFDTYSLGALDGQGGWYDGSNLIGVVNSFSFSSPYSIQGGGVAGAMSKNLDISAPPFYFDYSIYFNTTGAIGTGGFVGSANYLSGTAYDCANINSAGNIDGTYYGFLGLGNSVGGNVWKFQDLPLESWIRVQYETDENYSSRIRVSLDNGVNWSAWSSSESCETYGSGSFTNYIKTRFRDTIFIDNFISGSGLAPDSESPSEIKTISFQQPPDESSTPDFSNWALNYQYYTGTTTPLLLYFNIRTLTDAGNYIGDSHTIKTIIPDSTTTQTIFIPKTFVLQGNKWYNATANFWISPENILATSTSHFVVSTTSSAIWEIPPTSTTTSAGFVLTCDPDNNLFVDSLCHLGLYLFIPKFEDFSSFEETWDAIKNKIPIGYFTKAVTALESLTTDTTASFSFWSLGAITDYIRTFFTGAFWLLFVFWSFNRIRNLQI